MDWSRGAFHSGYLMINSPSEKLLALIYSGKCYLDCTDRVDSWVPKD